jgi:hypothetical protein
MNIKRSLSTYLLLVTCILFYSGATAYNLNEHPRIFINKEQLPLLAGRSGESLKKEYEIIKEQADRVVQQGYKPTNNRFSPPIPLVTCGICYLVEGQMGRESEQYATAIKKYWGDGKILNLKGDGFFGFHGMLYDWIYDALTSEERKKYGNQLGQWLRYYTDTPEIMLKNGNWWYNQTWGPAHLNTPNTRDGITPKLFVALAISGAGTTHEMDSRRYLDSWNKRVPAECIPAFDEMGGVWSESMGHGGYGPIVVIPWAFEAWRTATGEDLFSMSAPTGFLPEMTQWAVHTTVPFANHTAWIDDNIASPLRAFSRISPILSARFNDPVANAINEEGAQKGWSRIPWERFLFFDPTIEASTPAKENYPLACHFEGAGHVYMRENWDDPNSTWAFFGAGPSFAGHSRDDEGHFMISKKGYLVLRAGGSGHNDRDYYTGGSLAFNIVTIFNSEEQFRRTNPRQEKGVKNENDGGMIRYLYSSNSRTDRAEIKSYHHNDKFTYTAADLSKAYSSTKVNEVTRQFFYLRGEREFFIIFDRIDATNSSYPKHWFLHIPDEPEFDEKETVLKPDHVFSYRKNSATWLSDPAGEENVLSTGRARAFFTTLLPENPKITKRGGEGHDLWGHPNEPSAQYNHTIEGNRRSKLPIVPWRLEIEAPEGDKKTYFLNVIEIGEEEDTIRSDLNLIKQGEYSGVEINTPCCPVEILFSNQGELTARVKIGIEKQLVLQ